MRPRLSPLAALHRWWFPQPTTTEQCRALFNATSTIRVRFAGPVDRKFRLSRLQAAANRILRRSA